MWDVLNDISASVFDESTRSGYVFDIGYCECYLFVWVKEKC